MQEMAFQGSKFQKNMPHTRGLQPLPSPSNISNDKLRLIFFFTYCAYFPSFISNTIIYIQLE